MGNQNSANRDHELRSTWHSCLQNPGPNSRSTMFSTASGSSLSISKGRPTLCSPPKQQEMGGKAWLTAVTWCDYSTDCYRHLLLCVSTSVAAWVTLSKSLTPAVSCFFHWQSKVLFEDQRMSWLEKLLKRRKGIHVFWTLFGQLKPI